QIDANSRAIADTSARSQANSQRIGQMEQANNKRFSDIEKQQSNDRKEYRSGIAGSSAIAGLHYVDAKNAVAIGAASFKNEQGYAIGYRHKFSDNAAATLSAAGTSNGDTVVAGSMSIGW
ncbi:YadA C-terminal domain-containing protein, partial [Herbiconiux daphne]